MRIVSGLLFVHPSMGLGIVTSLTGDNASVTFADYPGKSYLISCSYIKSVYSFNAVSNVVKSVRDIIKKDLLDNFFTSSTRAKGHSIYVNQDAISIAEETPNQIKAYVLGTFIYDVNIQYNAGIVRMFCSCPVRDYCKHLFALIDYVKHEKTEQNPYIAHFEPNYPINEEIEAFFSFNEKMSFNLLDAINQQIEELTTNYSSKEIAQYFANHIEIGANSEQLCHRVLYIHNDLYQSLELFLNENVEFKRHSPFLNALKRNHDAVIEMLDYRNYGSDIFKRRETKILYYCLNHEFALACNTLSEPNFNHETKVVIAYYLSNLFNQSSKAYKEYIKKILINDEDLVFEAYQRTDNIPLQKALYLDFFDLFTMKGIHRDDINAIDIFTQEMEHINKNITIKKRKELLDLAKQSIVEGHEVDVLALIFNDWISYRNPTFTEEMRKEIFLEVKDNDLLLKIMNSTRGRYDYY